MKKKYVSRLSRLGICVTVEGENRHVDFTPGFIDDYGNRGCVFVTGDVKLQKAIEKHEGFGKDWMSKFYTNDVDPVESEDDVVRPDVDVQEDAPVRKKRKKKE